MATKPGKVMWGKKYPIMDAEHIPDLEHATAVYEFGHSMPREQAEHKAWNEYWVQRHREGAAAHYRGMKAAAAAGDIEEAQKHGALFGMHMERLGEDPMDKLPGEVEKLVNAEGKERTYKFKAHPTDMIFAPKEELVGGPGDGKPDQAFDSKALQSGTEDEVKEHGGDGKVAKEIAKDHLTEDPGYYK
jgi:hypothetical protein